MSARRGRSRECIESSVSGRRRRVVVLAQTIEFARFASITHSIHKVKSGLDNKVVEWKERRQKQKKRRKEKRQESNKLLPVSQMIGGKRVQLEAVHERIKSKTNRTGLKIGNDCKEFLSRFSKKAFVPENVSPDYWPYARWRFLQRISASVLSVYSTECMLRAIGIGARRSLPAAAAFNWLLKDGIGKIGKLAIVARLGSQYDLELKKFRFLSTVICNISCGLEMLTPFSPSNFLLLASLGNVGKSVGLSIALATQPAFHKKFALADNMADITAKSQAQHVVADTIGLGLALGMSYFANGISPWLRTALPILSFPVLAGMDIILVHSELRAINLKTLNCDRTQAIASHWVQNREVLQMAKISKIENMAFLSFSPEGVWPLKVVSLTSAVTDVDSLRYYLKYYGNEEYMLLPSVTRRGPMARKTLLLAYSHSASERDILKGVLQASYFRMLQKNGEESLSVLIQQSKHLAKNNMNQFMKDVASRGWQTSPMLLFDSGYPAYVIDSNWKSQLAC